MRRYDEICLFGRPHLGHGYGERVEVAMPYGAGERGTIDTFSPFRFLFNNLFTLSFDFFSHYALYPNPVHYAHLNNNRP